MFEAVSNLLNGNTPEKAKVSNMELVGQVKSIVEKFDANISVINAGIVSNKQTIDTLQNQNNIYAADVAYALRVRNKFAGIIE